TSPKRVKTLVMLRKILDAVRERGPISRRSPSQRCASVRVSVACRLVGLCNGGYQSKCSLSCPIN
ncbi:MAG: hypothetical protein WAO14_28785, partial [Pseudolabrys sp.]